MALFYLIRHGEPDYSEVEKNGFWGFGRDFAPLSEKGIQQAVHAAKDPRLKNARLIVSSPYTRALQTAQIISSVTGLIVRVETAMHEWIPDLTNQLSDAGDAVRSAQEFTAYQGVYPIGKTKPWETLEHMRRRMRSVADKYADLDTVILVGHGMAFRTLDYIEEMHPGQIIECYYHKNQSDCKYSFR